jgi:hypothetical protein
LQILREEQPLDHANGGLVALDDVAENFGDFEQTTGMFPRGGAHNGPLGKRLRIGLGHADDAIAGAAQGGINAEYDLMRVGNPAQGGFISRSRAALGATDAFLQPLELLETDAHTAIVPNEVRLQSRNAGRGGSRRMTGYYFLPELALEEEAAGAEATCDTGADS